MKCELCDGRKGKRFCMRLNNKMICTQCCVNRRNIKECSPECSYVREENYELIPTNSIELTEVGKGKVILFSESLFLPNACDCISINIEKIEINIKNSILISIQINFIIKSSVTRKFDMDELYMKDTWKRKDDKLLPFLQIYTIGTGKVYNEVLKCEDINENIVIENNHLDTWLPNSKIMNKSITQEQRKNLNIPYDIKIAPISIGKHFLGKNSTFFADLKLEKNYNLTFDVEYDSIHTIDNNIALSLGLFFPFEFVNYEDYKVNLLNDYLFNRQSQIQLLLPFETDEISCFAVPLENNAILSSPKYIKHDLNNMEKTFHYDQYTIFNHLFYLEPKKKTDVNAIYTKLPIFTGLYDTFNKIYENEYAPVNITLFNNYDEIRKYKIEVEIQGLSYKKIQEVYVNPHTIENQKIAPQLIEEKVNEITSNCEKNVYVKVEEEGKIIYENTNECLIYPREIFVEKLQNNRKDWKIDFRSFLAKWVTPNAEAIDTLISKASERGDIVGGITQNLLRTEEDIKKIYDELSEIKYSIRTLSFPEGNYHIQRISLPKNTLRLNSGNCIDLSLLLASCFEAIKIKTYIVLIPQHAMVMVELNDGNRICIESTCLGHKEYYEAKEIGNENYKKYFKDKDPLDPNAYIVDISLARKSNIFPMN